MATLSNINSKVVLLDRDGTLIEECHYLHEPSEVKLLPASIAGLRHFSRLGFRLVVISNQSGIGRGYYTIHDYCRVTARLKALLAEAGLFLDGIYCCPHTPEDNCLCRKPQTGLVQRAAEDLGFLPKRCVVIGDKLSDMRLAINLECHSILVRTGYGTKTESGPKCWDFVADDLAEAAAIVETKLCGG